MDAPLLIPTPRRMKLLGGQREFPALLGVHAVDAALTGHAARMLGGLAREGKQAEVLLRLETGAPARAGAYSLRIEETGSIRIFARDAAGLHNGVATLRQLRRQYGTRLPLLIIEDAPAFVHRGVMLDISRDRVPTMRHLFETVEKLAELKFNHLQLYTEHTFAYAGHEEVWQDASPMTPEEYRALDAHCRAFNITLAANQNCFGHLASWLKRPRYQHLAEITGEETVWKFYHFDRKGPFSLCPIESQAPAFVDELLGQLLPCFSSGLCNINCDETFDVGQGRSQEACRERGAGVYFDFLDRVVASVRARNFRPMFWADIALSHPEAIDRIPADMICLAWDYEPSARFGLWCQTLRGQHGRPVWVCPGTSSWRSIAGRTLERRGNIGAAAEEGVRGGAEGFLVCDWGDVGHRQQWPVSLHAIANAAEAAWTGAGGERDEAGKPLRLRAESLHVFDDREGKIGPLLEAAGDIDLHLRAIGGRPAADGSPTALRNATLFFHDYHLPWTDPFKPGSIDAWMEAADRAEALARDVSGLGAGVSPLTVDEIGHTLRVVGTMIERGLLRRRLASPEGSATRALAERIDQTLEDHRRLWLVRSRPGGLEKSCVHDRAARCELPG